MLVDNKINRIVEIDYQQHGLRIQNAVSISNSTTVKMQKDEISQSLPKLKLPPTFVASLSIYISEVLAGSKTSRDLTSWMKPHVLMRLNQVKVSSDEFGNRPQVVTTHVKRLNDRKAYTFCIIRTNVKTITICLTFEQNHTKWIITDFNWV